MLQDVPEVKVQFKFDDMFAPFIALDAVVTKPKFVEFSLQGFICQVG